MSWYARTWGAVTRHEDLPDFTLLKMLAFLIDQVQQRCCGLFQQELAKQDRKRYFWEKLCSFYFIWLLPDWETLYKVPAYAPPSVIVPYDTSCSLPWPSSSRRGTSGETRPTVASPRMPGGARIP